MIIAIDGPAGSGKSTIAKLIAKDLGMIYLDTGAMYRLFTLKILKEKINFYATKEIIKLLSNLKIDIKKDKFYLDGEDVTEEIRKTEVSMIVSKVATIKEVRETMVDHQIEFSKSKNIILDGRDIGTVVFPNADLKIFLVADPMERAKRRYKELIKKGEKDKARDEADYGLLRILNLRENGLPDGSYIEGQPMDTWINRFWIFLEKHNLMLG